MKEIDKFDFETVKKIIKYFTEGEKYIDESKHASWEDYVLDSYVNHSNGVDVESTIELLKAIDKNPDMSTVDHTLEIQQNTNDNIGFLKLTIFETIQFSKYGKDFKRYIDKKINANKNNIEKI